MNYFLKSKSESFVLSRGCLKIMEDNTMHLPKLNIHVTDIQDEISSTKIVYLLGDATKPKASDETDQRIIIHICNNIDRWGKGFVVALSKRWKEPEEIYHKMEKKLGTISCCWVEDIGDDIDSAGYIGIINMIAQHNIKSENNIKPIRYDALETCLKTIIDVTLPDLKKKYNEINVDVNFSFHLPRIGRGLAGGSWDKVSGLIEKYLCKNGHKVYVYDLA